MNCSDTWELANRMLIAELNSLLICERIDEKQSNASHVSALPGVELSTSRSGRRLSLSTF